MSDSNPFFHHWLHQLIADSQQCQIPLQMEQAERLLQFCQLLLKWNQAYNLTAITDLEQMRLLHILDSLAIAPYLPKTACDLLDIGSGAGLPGIPLAIVNPHWHITSLDANRKKILFQKQAAAQLQLQNVTPIHARIAEFAHTQTAQKPQFDVIICRALASLAEIVQWLDPLLIPEVQLIAMKGQYPETELADLDCAFEVQVVPVTIPALQQQRHLVKIMRK